MRNPRESRSAALGLHLYQPKRRGDHSLIRETSTDPLGADWNGIAIERCYRKLATSGALQNFDVYATLRTEIAKRDPETSRLMAEAMQQNGIGDSFLHNILPDMSFEDKTILVGAGREQYFRDVSKQPLVFWAPESAYDSQTLEVLVNFGYKAFICAPEQIIQQDGEASDNRPTLINLPSGRSIIALPFDRPVSSALGFDSEGRKNADTFVERHILPALERNEERRARRGDKTPNVMIAYTDGETFGLHDEFGHLFILYLGKEALQNHGINALSINDLVEEITSSRTELTVGKLRENTSWSCPHGIDRWHKNCGCVGEDGSWKTPFYEAGKRLNEQISEIIYREIPNYNQILIPAFNELLTNRGGSQSSADQSLLSAKASALAARTSCGTFFGDPWTSGYINIMFGLQAIYHLRDAGLNHAADSIQNDFMKLLGGVFVNGKSAKSVAERMLRGEKIID